jgi:selenocysteine lyase/cysteine desulfurase
VSATPGDRLKPVTAAGVSATPGDRLKPVTAARVGDAIRGEFPIFAHTTYLNSCSQGALSHRVRAAYEEYLQGWDENGAEWEFWVERAEAARAGFAELLHGRPDEVAVTTSVTQGVSGIVSALPFERGGRTRIVISEYEFPTVGQIAHAQELRGAEVVHVVPEADGSIPSEKFADAIDERTALVCCTTISYRTGHRHDVAAIAEAAHANGALVLADSYQAAGAIELDVRTLGADFVTGGTVKYLLASAGLGFLWVRGELLERLLPTQTGWFADEDIFRMDISDYSPHATARRFDAGTPPVPNIYAGVAGLGLVQETGVPAVEAHVRELNTRLIEGLQELGASVATPADPARRGPLVCVRSTDAPALVASLAEERITCSLRDANLRIASHLYNTDADVDTLLEALSRRRHLLA